MSSVGEILSKARKKQGKTIVQIEEVTKIPGKYIKALEADQFHIIPGDVYVKGFLHTYASYLSLDSSELIKAYKETLTPPPPKKEPETSIITSTAKRSSKKKIIALTAAVIVIAVLAGLRWLGGVQQKPVKVLGTKVTKKEASDKKESEPKSAPKKEASPASTQRVTVKVKAVDEHGCWVRVMVDGNKVFEDTLGGGEEKEWQGNQSISIRAGRPSSLQVTYNGKDLGLFGEASGATERTFTPNPLQD